MAFSGQFGKYNGSNGPCTYPSRALRSHRSNVSLNHTDVREGWQFQGERIHFNNVDIFDSKNILKMVSGKIDCFSPWLEYTQSCSKHTVERLRWRRAEKGTLGRTSVFAFSANSTPSELVVWHSAMMYKVTNNGAHCSESTMARTGFIAKLDYRPWRRSRWNCANNTGRWSATIASK